MSLNNSSGGVFIEEGLTPPQRVVSSSPCACEFVLKNASFGK